VAKAGAAGACDIAAAKQWSPADKLATVIQTAGLSGLELGSEHP
jgi:hypothetical protein